MHVIRSRLARVAHMWSRWWVTDCVAFLVIAASAFAQQPATSSTRIRFVAEARQLGPVGYRDPIGVMSPDGQWLAYASAGRLRVTTVAGGAVSTLAPLARVAAVAWQPDSRRVAHYEIDRDGNGRWIATDISGGVRRPLWTGTFARALSGSDSVPIDPNRFREIAWSRDGAHLAGLIPQPRGTLLWTGNPDGSRGRVTRIESRVGSLAWSPEGR